MQLHINLFVIYIDELRVFTGFRSHSTISYAAIILTSDAISNCTHTIIPEKFSSQKIFNLKLFDLKVFVFKGDGRKFLWANYFNNIITSLLIKCDRQPDNERDQYVAKYKHGLGSEHTFKHTANLKFLQSSFNLPRVAAQALIPQAMRPSVLTSGYFSL